MTANTVSLRTMINAVSKWYTALNKPMPANCVIMVKELPFITAESWDDIENYQRTVAYTAMELDTPFANDRIVFPCPGCGYRQCVTYRQLGCDGKYCLSPDEKCSRRSACAGSNPSKRPPMNTFELARICWRSGLRMIPPEDGQVGQLKQLTTKCLRCEDVMIATPQNRERVSREFRCRVASCHANRLRELAQQEDGEMKAVDTTPDVSVKLFARNSNHLQDLQSLGMSSDGNLPIRTQTQRFTLVCKLGHKTPDQCVVNVKQWYTKMIDRHPCSTCAKNDVWHNMLERLQDIGIKKEMVGELRDQRTVIDLNTTIRVTCANRHLTEQSINSFMDQVRKRTDSDGHWHCVFCTKDERHLSAVDEIARIAKTRGFSVVKMYNNGHIDIQCSTCVAVLKTTADEIRSHDWVGCTHCTSHRLNSLLNSLSASSSKPYTLTRLGRTIDIQGYEGIVIEWLLERGKKLDDLVWGIQAAKEHHVIMKREDGTMSYAFPDIVVKSERWLIEVKPGSPRPDELRRVQAKCRAYVSVVDVKKASIVYVGYTKMNETSRNLLAVLSQDIYLSTEYPPVREEYAKESVESGVVGVVQREMKFGEMELVDQTSPSTDTEMKVDGSDGSDTITVSDDGWKSTGEPWFVDVNRDGRVRNSHTHASIRLRTAGRAPWVLVKDTNGKELKPALSVLMANAFKVHGHELLANKSATTNWTGTGYSLDNLQVLVKQEVAVANRMQVELDSVHQAVRDRLLELGKEGKDALLIHLRRLKKSEWFEAGRSMRLITSQLTPRENAVNNICEAVMNAV